MDRLLAQIFDSYNLLFLAATVGASLGLWLSNSFLLRREERGLAAGRSFRLLAMLFLTALVTVAMLLALPIDRGTREQLLGLVGLVLTAVIAMSSTSFVANAMAGLMLRAVRNFQPGDFIRIGEHFGRVSEMGVFHTEIQTEDRDLTTLPNLHLVQNPVVVVHSSGTIVSVLVSLGYDVPRSTLESLLVEASAEAGLQGGFVQVRDLLDHAVVYRVAGFLQEVDELIAVRSRLRSAILDTLHGARVEIVSPSFMNQRALGAAQVIPSPSHQPENEMDRLTAETLAFEKAERAAQVERFREQIAELGKDIEESELALKNVDAAERENAEKRIEDLRARRDHLVEGMRLVAASEEV